MSIASVNLARYMIEKHSLELPINVKSLVEARAELLFAPIPMEGIDGVSINLKVQGKRTRVIVNSNNSPMRQRFTLAHELGHIVIPWHTGSFVDHLDAGQPNETDDYWEYEIEANAFAGELLVPTEWLRERLSKRNDLARVNKLIAKKCEVSLHAASIRLSQILPKNFVYAVERHDIVEFAGRSEGTFANMLEWGSDFDSDAYDYYEEHFSSSIGDRNIHWWKLPDSFSVSESDVRSWREILTYILSDLGVGSDEMPRTKQSINGVFAYANDLAKRSGDYSQGSVAAACIQRFKDRAELKPFAQHPDFETFIVRRARDLVESRR